MTHFIKSAHLNGGKDCNIRLTDGQRNSPSVFCKPRKCSRCPLFVTRQTSIRKSISAHTRCSRSQSISEMAAKNRLHSSGRSRGTGYRKAESLIYPHNNKSHGDKSGDLGGQRYSARSLLPSPPFSLNLFLPWRPPTKLNVCSKYT